MGALKAGDLLSCVGKGNSEWARAAAECSHACSNGERNEAGQ